MYRMGSGTSGQPSSPGPPPIRNTQAALSEASDKVDAAKGLIDEYGIIEATGSFIPAEAAGTASEAVAWSAANFAGREIGSIDKPIPGALGQRAKEIHSALKSGVQGRTTTAVASGTTADGQPITMVASSEDVLRKEQLQVLKPGEVPIKGSGHAETTILEYAKKEGINVPAIGASRPICSSCAEAMKAAGVAADSPLKITTKAATDATFVKKPPLLPMR